MEIRGHQYKAAQGIATISDTTSGQTVIAGIAGKTLYLNYITISLSDVAVGTGQLTDGDGGTIFWKQDENSGNHAPTSYQVYFGEYGFALTEGNGLFGITSTSNMDYTIAALGYYK